MNSQCLRGRKDSDLKFTNSAFISSPIGLANKLVQFKKRPLYPCSLKAAYTQKKNPMRRTSDIKNFKTRKNSP